MRADTPRTPAPSRRRPAARAAPVPRGRGGDADTARATAALRTGSWHLPSQGDAQLERERRQEVVAATGIRPQPRGLVEGVVASSALGRAQPHLPGGCVF